MKATTIIKYVFTFVGIAMLAGALFIYKSTISFFDEAAIVEGTIVELVPSQSRNTTTFRPVVQFISLDGQAIEFISSSGSNPPSYSKGEVVEVLYDPADPHAAKINDFFSLWGASLILGAMGGVFFLIGIGLIIASIPDKNYSKEM